MKFHISAGLLKWIPSGSNEHTLLPSINQAIIWIATAMFYMEICLRRNDVNMRVVAQEIRGYLNLKVCMRLFQTRPFFFSVF
jgi:hypothetical protein